MAEEVSLFRLYALRTVYLPNVLFVGGNAVNAFIHRAAPWDPVTGVAFSFWAALAALFAVGIRYPLAMLPILFIQILYKTFWMIGVYLPLRAAGRGSEMMPVFLAAIVVDVLVMPWGYVRAHYIKGPGNRWRAASGTNR